MSRRVNEAGSRNDALGPAPRSVEMRAPSSRRSVRPRARPRMAGVRLWPSEMALTPGMFSSACAIVTGRRSPRSGAVTDAPDAPGATSMPGARPRTVTVSLTAASTISRRSVVAFAASIRIGRATLPSGRTTTTTTGGGGMSIHVNVPSGPVRTDSREPTIVTSAPARGLPVRASMTTPPGGRGRSIPTRQRRSARASTAYSTPA